VVRGGRGVIAVARSRETNMEAMYLGAFGWVSSAGESRCGIGRGRVDSGTQCACSYSPSWGSRPSAGPDLFQPIPCPDVTCWFPSADIPRRRGADRGLGHVFPAWWTGDGKRELADRVRRVHDAWAAHGHAGADVRAGRRPHGAFHVLQVFDWPGNYWMVGNAPSALSEGYSMTSVGVRGSALFSADYLGLPDQIRGGVLHDVERNSTEFGSDARVNAGLRMGGWRVGIGPVLQWGHARPQGRTHARRSGFLGDGLLR
jgi:hypothetical protein